MPGERKTILLTGGTGSFGQGFVKHLLSDPEIGMIRIYSRDEHKQRRMREIYRNRVSFYIGDVRDKDRLCRVMRGCHWVVHAAALKQCPVGEIEAQEFIKTNVFGSMNVVESALDCEVEKALLISTDKAVEPINLYGATKMCAEKIFLQADMMRSPHQTMFACTRYGNIAGTNGSIIPLLLALKPDDPSPICDPLATRFWIDLDEANAFVLASLKEMVGGEIFFPTMKSVKIIDIARALRPGKEIKVIGSRVGDKRHEVIYSDGNGCKKTSDQCALMTEEEIRQHVFGNETADKLLA